MFRTEPIFPAISKQLSPLVVGKNSVFHDTVYAAGNDSKKKL
jgi:hypothetical protein